MTTAKTKTAPITKEVLGAAQQGDPDAAQFIMEAMEQRLAKEAHRICGAYHVEDAISAGRVALWEAIVNNDPDDDRASFETFAIFMARNAMVDFVRSNGAGVSVPERTAGRYDFIMRAAEGDYERAVEMIRTSDDPELGTVETFAAAHRALGDDTKHLDYSPSSAEGEEDDSSDTMDWADHRIDVEGAALNRVVVDALLGECNEREVLILSMTYGIGGRPEMKDQDIADALGISRPRVVTIRKAAQERLAAANTELAGVI